mmetsp:Transcript_10238/g.21592  ORF Transcript_10238/g.21592 Transcript_10238/m.21592 type:complete len:220 (-) Transcript_10238:725-1384(-)
MVRATWIRGVIPPRSISSQKAKVGIIIAAQRRHVIFVLRLKVGKNARPRLGEEHHGEQIGPAHHSLASAAQREEGAAHRNAQQIDAHALRNAEGRIDGLVQCDVERIPYDGGEDDAEYEVDDEAYDGGGDEADGRGAVVVAVSFVFALFGIHAHAARSFLFGVVGDDTVWQSSCAGGIEGREVDVILLLPCEGIALVGDGDRGGRRERRAVAFLIRPRR